MSLGTFAVFCQDTGRIDRILQCPTGCVEASLGPNEDAIAVTTETDATHYVESNALVAFPTRPSAFHDWDWSAKVWVLNSDRAWRSVRVTRGRKIAESDWTQLPDAPLTTLQKAAWATYRQQLRDVTLQPDPLNITWPQEPA